MIIVHHLQNSRSQRVLWLLEELELPYEVRRYERANGLDALIHDVVTKPFSLAEIRRAVSDALLGICREETRRYA